MNAENGVTLLEMMLVLAIAMSMLVLGVKVYDQFQFQANEKKIMANVNQLFQALQGFYYANCRQTLSPTSVPQPQTSGALDPTQTDPLGGPPLAKKVISIQNDLISQGFMPAGWRPVNVLLGDPDQTYFVQYNRILPKGADPVMSVFACTGDQAPPSCNKTSGAELSTAELPSQQSRVVIWNLQVAVKLSDNLSKAEQNVIKNDLRADCISTLATDSVTPCAADPTENGYLVWTKSPSAYNPDTTSVFWLANPYVKQFNRQYTNDPMATLSGVTNEAQTWYNPFNYLCGG